MDIREIKLKSKEFAFSNKWLIWKPLLLIYAITFITTFISELVLTFNEGLGSIIGVIFEIIVLFITPLLTVALIAMIISRVKGNNEATFKNKVEEYKSKWTNFLMGYVMMEIYIFLWSLLFIIPGIIKAIEYSQVYAIYSKDPDIEWRQCLEKSKSMMKGHKMEYFIMNLSFIGWYFLSVFTFGIALIWVLPYVTVTQVNYFLALTGEENISENVEINEVVTCPFCGQETEKDAKFCPKCGSHL